MTITYVIYNHTDEMTAIAQWAALLLPITWLKGQSKFKDEEEIQQFLIGRIMLYQQLTQLGYEYGKLPTMHYDKNGHPYFDIDLYFDIATTNDTISVAVSTKQPVGIKVEEIRPITWESFRSYFTAREWYHVAKSNELASFKLVKNWVAREAAIKIMGESCPIQDVKLTKETLELKEETIFHTSMNLPSNYIGTAVTKEKCEVIKTTNITPMIYSQLQIIRA